MTAARRVDLSQRAAKLNEAENKGAQLQDTVLRGSEGRFLRRVSLQPLPLLAADTIADRLRLHLPALDTSKETTDNERDWLLLHALGAANNTPAATLAVFHQTYFSYLEQRAPMIAVLQLLME